MPKLNTTIQERISDTQRKEIKNEDITDILEVNEALMFNQYYNIKKSGSLKITKEISTKNLLILS